MSFPMPGRPVRLIVCGGRDFKDADWLLKVLNVWESIFGRENLVIIQGGARGADAYAKAWAESREIACETYPADWDKHGKAAGPIRNQEMLDQHPDFVLAFPGGNGTADMVARARRAGVPVAEAKL
jgi:hypothetical protein